MVWSPSTAAERAYFAQPAPPASESRLAAFWPEPLDRTYGRAGLALRYPAEEELRQTVDPRDGSVEFGFAGKRERVAFTTWSPRAARNGRDLVWVHGINDYGAKFAQHAPQFLDAGYRIISLDLPSHGKSTGLHCHLPDLDVCSVAVYEVLKAVLAYDKSLGEERKPTFVAGQSLGGYVAVATCINYGSVAASPDLPHIVGGLFLCPMLFISPSSRPSYLVELFARAISSFAGALAVTNSTRGLNSEDPACEEQFTQDPSTYHGPLRVATGLGILKAITTIDGRMGELSIPFSCFHGTGDR